MLCREGVIVRLIMIAAMGWLGFNLVLFAALLMRRDRPELRARLAAWVVGAHRAKLAQRNAQPAEPSAQGGNWGRSPANGDRS